jgi:CheY-like chemotaxis protein
MGAVTRVLVVDDDEGIRETIRFALEDVGYAVAEAADGLAALQRLRAGKDRMVVVLDLMMLMTANTRTLTLAFATLLQNLSIPVLAKPFDVDVLLDAVAAAAHRLAR